MVTSRWSPSPSQSCYLSLKALADETRWRIVDELLRSPMTVGELGERLQVSQYNVSKHLRILRECGFIETSKEGRYVRTRVSESLQCPPDQGEPSHVLKLGCCEFRF